MCLERWLPYSRDNLCLLHPWELCITLIPKLRPTWGQQHGLHGGLSPLQLAPPHNHCVPSLEVNTLPVDLESGDLASSPSSTVLPWASYLTSLCLSFLTCKRIKKSLPHNTNYIVTKKLNIYTAMSVQQCLKHV